MTSKTYIFQILTMTLLTIGVIPLYKYFGIFGQGWWHYTGYLYLMGCILFFVLFARHNQWTPHSLGLRTDNIKSSTFPYIFFTIFWILILILFGIFLKGEINIPQIMNKHLAGLFLISAILQEFFFRSLWIRLQKELFSNTFLLILFNALLFASIHLVFETHTFLITLFTFFLGTGFAIIYLKYPNFYMITLSHAIINLVGIALLYG